MTIEEIIKGMLAGKKYHSTLWADTYEYCYYSGEGNYPFRIVEGGEDTKIINWRSLTDRPETFSEYIEPIKDKAPVWVWGDKELTDRTVSFYNAKNDSVFNFWGKRSKLKWANVVAINLEEYPQSFRDMVTEMAKHLED